MVARVSEQYWVYSMDKDGRYRDPAIVDGVMHAIEACARAAQTSHEVRVTDSDDVIIFHIVAKKVVFPAKDTIFPHILELLANLRIE